MWQQMFRLGRFYFEVTVFQSFWPSWVLGGSVGTNMLWLDIVIYRLHISWGMGR